MCSGSLDLGDYWESITIRSLEFFYTEIPRNGVINSLFIYTHTIHKTRLLVACPESSVFSNCGTVEDEWDTGILWPLRPRFVQAIPDRHLTISYSALFDPIPDIVGVLCSWIYPSSHTENSIGKDLNDRVVYEDVQVESLQVPIDVPQAEFPLFGHVVELIVKGTHGPIDKDGFVRNVNV